MDIEGPLVCGRYIRAKKLLQQSGEHTPMPGEIPEVFREGGEHRPAVGGKGKGKTGKVWGWRDERVHSVMGLVQMHEGEYRRWHPAWGPSHGGNEDWQKILQPAVAGLADHQILRHHQMAMSGSGSTIVRRSSSSTHEARNVFIANFPDVLLFFHMQRTADKVYEEWTECEVIIGKRPRRGR